MGDGGVLVLTFATSQRRKVLRPCLARKGDAIFPIFHKNYVGKMEACLACIILKINGINWVRLLNYGICVLWEKLYYKSSDIDEKV